MKVVVDLDMGLSQRDTEDFVGRLLEIGSLNSDRKYDLQKWPDLKRGTIRIIREIK